MSIAQDSTENRTLSCIRRRTSSGIHLRSTGSSSFVSLLLCVYYWQLEVSYTFCYSVNQFNASSDSFHSVCFHIHEILVLMLYSVVKFWVSFLWRFVADLIQFGAVYYALVCPQPPPTATEEQIRIFRKVTEPAVLRKRASIKGKTLREAQKTFRVTLADQFVEAGTYLRVHVHPKRFPRYTSNYLLIVETINTR